MEVASTLRINGSDRGNKSYANNSILQRTVISKVRPIVEKAVKKSIQHNKDFLKQPFTMANLGCSSGPNTLLSISNVIDAIVEVCQQASHSTPDLQVFLNDLHDNDFNSIFQSLPSFYERLQIEKCQALSSCYISATPGSFYGRLFPTSSTHFVLSTYSLHWLSQFPRGIENKGNIFMAKTSPNNVSEAYSKQFEMDFTNFLSHHAMEIKTGGTMILAFLGRSTDDPTTNDCCLVMELLSKSLLDMAAERTAISKVRPMVEQAVKKSIMQHNKVFLKQPFTMADLGCSSGPNTLLSISNVIDAIVEVCQQACYSTPELQVFLNDLPDNDFNSVFQSLPDFYKMLQIEKGKALTSCYISATSGSFYGRLFPTSSLHFVVSTYSLHWLSQVPRGIENKGNIFMAKTSPNNVFEAYSKQFEMDFTNFLRHRAMEINSGGTMILAFLGRSTDDPTIDDCCLVMELLSKSLLDMTAEGLIEEGEVDSFNLPHYKPSKGEVKGIVEKQGSFNIDHLDTFLLNWDTDDTEENENYEFDKEKSGQNVANTIRVVTESMLASHFGEGVIEDLFGRYAKYAGEHLYMEKTKNVNIVISMTKN